MPANSIVKGFLDAALEDLDAARRLLAVPPNRLAAYHLQQAAEKLGKALLSSRDIHVTREHRLVMLVQQLPAGEPWHPCWRRSRIWIGSPRRFAIQGPPGDCPRARRRTRLALTSRASRSCSPGPGVSWTDSRARDAIHLAIMNRHGIETIYSYDHHFDGLPGVRRVEP